MALYTRSTQVVFALLCLLSCDVFADRLLILDQSGKPVKGAVIELADVEGGAPAVDEKQTAVMDQINKRFVPELLVINVNEYVNFPNSDNIRHHVYSFSPTKPFELKLYSGQPEAPLSFEKPGIVVLGCNIHDSMVGYIYVSESEYVHTTGDDGRVLVDSSIHYQGLTVWHPNQSSGHMTVKHFSRDTLKPLDGDNQTIVIELSITQPEPRNTFQDVFKHDH